MRLEVFPTTANTPHPLSTIPKTHHSFSSPHTHFRAPTFTQTLFPPFLRNFNFYHAFSCVFDYCQLFPSPTMQPHKSTTFPSCFQDSPPISECILPFLPSRTISRFSQPLQRVFTQSQLLSTPYELLNVFSDVFEFNHLHFRSFKVIFAHFRLFSPF